MGRPGYIAVGVLVGTIVIAVPAGAEDAATASAVAPRPSSTYSGVLGGKARHAKLTLRTSANAKSISATVKCLRGHGHPGKIARLPVRRGRFAGKARHGGRVSWSIKGRFTSARGAVANLKLSAVCDRAHGAVRLVIRGGPKHGGQGNGHGAGETENGRPGQVGGGLVLNKDVSRAVAQSVGPAGGTLTAVDAAGDSLSLGIPPGALGEERLITMTPLASVSGGPLPDGGFAGGVDLQPDGLQLMKTATLTVVPAHPVPAGKTAAFTYTGGGSDFHLTIPGPDAAADFKIPVTHFTGYGAWEADAAAQHAANQQPAQTPEGRAQQALAEDISEWRSEAIDEQTFKERAARVLQDFYDHGIAPEIPTAMNDDATAARTIRELLSFEREAALLGVEVAPDEGEAFATIREILLKMMDRAEADCAENHHLAQAFRMLSLSRDYVLVGGSEISPQTSLRCLKFRLDFDSTMHEDTEGGFFTQEVKAEVPVSIKLTGQLTFEGSGPESYALATGEVPADCPEHDRVVLESGTPGTFKVMNLDLGLDATTARNEPNQLVTALKVKGTPGQSPGGPPYETYRGYPCEGGTGTESAATWLALFTGYHALELHGLYEFEFEGFEPQSGADIGRRQYLGQLGESSELTTITLVHTPPPN